MKINRCKCGSDNVEFVKIFQKNMYAGFVRCNDCGCEGRIYTTRYNAVKAWNDGKGIWVVAEDKVSEFLNEKTDEATIGRIYEMADKFEKMCSRTVR